MLIAKIALAGLVCAHAMGLAAAGPARARDGQETQKTAAKREAVQLFVVVTDRSGQFVEGLTVKDFVLIEDGVQQPVDLFLMEKTEGTSGSLSPAQGQAAHTVPGARQAPAGPASSRVIVLLVDTAHVSSGGLERVRVALRRFVDEQKTERDLIAVMTSAGKPGVTGEFTADESIVKAAMDKIRPGYTQFESFLTPVLCGRVVQRDPQAVGLASLILDSENRTSGSVQMPRSGNDEADAVSKCRMQLLETASRRRALMNAIGAAVDKMSGLPGQHMIALFTEGFSMVATGGEVAISEVRPAISSAVRSGVMMYSFDVKDPMASKPVTMESYSLASEIQNNRRDLQHGTSLLAGQTGGDAFYNVDGLSNQLQNMLDANRVCYRLVYYPPSTADPRKFRSISVSVKEHPEYQIRTPKGYDMTAPRKSK